MLTAAIAGVVDHPCIKHAWIATTMNYVHVHRTHVEDTWFAAQSRLERPAHRLCGIPVPPWPRGSPNRPLIPQRFSLRTENSLRQDSKVLPGTVAFYCDKADVDHSII
jgi:hypothetical protein